MTMLPDAEARKTALTAVDRTLLVEAGAGSGKTSVMAGRVAVLLSKGAEPKHIAAITFTEFAASELRQRIERFTTQLSLGEVPKDLRQAFPDGVDAAQRENLSKALGAFDQLMCGTIHGFAQALIKPYPAEANIDPGADIVDPAEAELAFQERYDAWLRSQLSGEHNDGLVAQIVLSDVNGGLKFVAEVAEFLRDNRDATCAQIGWSHQGLADLTAAVGQFQKDLAGYDFLEQQTSECCKVLGEIVAILQGHGLSVPNPSNAALVAALNFHRHETCFTQEGKRRQLRVSGKWQDAAAKAGRTKAAGKLASEAMVLRYDACHTAISILLGAVSRELLLRLCNEMARLREDWRGYKRAAALLDFEDLLYKARDLLAKNAEVREALSKRFRHVLVDEFQDTDPLQTEILWLLCGDDGAGEPLSRSLRPGALFLVGDPKQAIYRFRGADVNAYIAARAAIAPDSLLKITANFRSVEPILKFVNKQFEQPLSESAGQPGFSELSPVHPAGADPGVVALDVMVDDEKPSAGTIRDAEAVAVADLCGRLAGNLMVRDRQTNELRKCRFGDIALLAPASTELWRFEEALEDLGIPVSTQAGKGFFRRQEIQDLVALTCALADPRDSLALGAFLRGPIVGMTESELLDIVEQLPIDPDQPDRLPMLSLRTEPDQIGNATASNTIRILAFLRRQGRKTTPYSLLSDAVAALHVRTQLRQRFQEGTERAVANVDLFLESARAYDIRGLRAFAKDMRANWEDSVRQVEGRPDAEEQSVSLITVHSAKGLEWSVVIPLNMTGRPQAESGLAHDRSSSLFSVPVLGNDPPDYDGIKSKNAVESTRERVRLWYVATTRARDLLILPRHSAKLSDESWIHIVDLGLEQLPALDASSIGAPGPAPARSGQNLQTREIFAAEAAKIIADRKTVTWRRPSRAELDLRESDDLEPAVTSEAVELPPSVIVGSSTRGVILHKLIEEILTGETEDTPEQVEVRAGELLKQLGLEAAQDPHGGVSPAELSATVMRTLALPEIKDLRHRLVAELPVFASSITGDGETLISGLADAVALDEHGAIDVVIDWKSDVAPDIAALDHYRQQIGDYRKQTKAKRALVVLMTSGKVIEVAA
ncbi:UvrD-helicase domain-containing protein [Nitrobacter winogradskyi]|uniref:Exodeoxyribonuclease-5 n=2 Tax=Nitrobacter winogradskyi TaxID=913 RepID=A0ACC6AQ61_NITWI|nr:UvrD-helicase domain-containing protein [Nitrobacter winogradskyi]MCP2001401.1 exodeoxyribonuclease-5 [Nitrobacter winogradskyi]GEC15447.1 DNA helicase [Nitrobacter winogradskyi]